MADVSDVSSNVTLKSYTVHLEVPVCYIMHGLCMVCQLHDDKPNSLVKSAQSEP